MVIKLNVQIIEVYHCRHLHTKFYQTFFSLSGVAQSVQCLATDRMTGPSGFDSQHRRKNFSSNLCVQTGSEAHPASCTMGTGGPFTVAKERPGRDAYHSPLLVLRSRMSRSYNFSPPNAFMACNGTALAFIFLFMQIPKLIN
jgi:hypothetical protein